MNLNKAMLIGRLTRDPEARTTPSGKAVTSFSIATNRVWSDATGNKQEATEYHNIVIWGRLAEISAQYLQKGQEVYIEGRLQTRSWDGQDGVKRYTTEIVADNMQMGSKAAFKPQQDQQQAPAAAPASANFNAEPFSSSAPTQEPNQQGASDSGEITIENIPF
ncbi:MAG: single-stranded DNA-binding protein [bacterium]